mgnify:CR=1 FL=1
MLFRRSVSDIEILSKLEEADTRIDCSEFLEQFQPCDRIHVANRLSAFLRRGFLCSQSWGAGLVAFTDQGFSYLSHLQDLRYIRANDALTRALSAASVLIALGSLVVSIIALCRS